MPAHGEWADKSWNVHVASHRHNETRPEHTVHNSIYMKFKGRQTRAPLGSQHRSYLRVGEGLGRGTAGTSEGLVMSYFLICEIVTQVCSFRENSSHYSF